MVRVPARRGRGKRKHVYGTTRKEVAKKVRAVQDDLDKGLPVTTQRQSVAQFLHDWLEPTVKPNRRAKTYRSYEQIVRMHFVPPLVKLRLEKLTPQHVQRVLNEKLESGLSARTVQYLHSTLRAALNQEHRIAQLQDRLVSGDEWVDSDHVFTATNGAQLDDANVRRIFKGLLRDAGLPPFRYHDLRHTCASLLLAQNVHPRVVMETLGHSQISLTMGAYSHVSSELQREAADRMNALFVDRPVTL